MIVKGGGRQQWFFFCRLAWQHRISIESQAQTICCLFCGMQKCAKLNELLLSACVKNESSHMGRYTLTQLTQLTHPRKQLQYSPHPTPRLLQEAAQSLVSPPLPQMSKKIDACYHTGGVDGFQILLRDPIQPSPLQPDAPRSQAPTLNPQPKYQIYRVTLQGVDITHSKQYYTNT